MLKLVVKNFDSGWLDCLLGSVRMVFFKWLGLINSCLEVLKLGVCIVGMYVLLKFFICCMFNILLIRGIWLVNGCLIESVFILF